MHNTKVRSEAVVTYGELVSIRALVQVRQAGLIEGILMHNTKVRSEAVVTYGKPVSIRALGAKFTNQN